MNSAKVALRVAALRVGAVAFSLGVAGLVGTAGMGTAFADEGGQSSSSSSSDSSSSSAASAGSSSSSPSPSVGSTESSSTAHTDSDSTGGSTASGTRPRTTFGSGRSTTKPDRDLSETRSTRSSSSERTSRRTKVDSPAESSAKDTTTDSASASSTGTATSAPVTKTVEDVSKSQTNTPPELVDSAPIVAEVTTERESRKNRSDRVAAESPASHRATAAVIGSTSQANNDTGDRSLARVTDSGATDVTASRTATNVETVAETPTTAVEIDAPLMLSENVGADNHGTIAQSGDPAPSTAPIGVVSGLLSAVGLGSPLSTVDGPVDPLPGVFLVGSLDLVRRDLEQLNDSQSADDTQPVTNTSITETPSEELLPVGTTAAADSNSEPPPVWTVPDELTIEPTSAERTAAYMKAQAERIEAFNEAQAARKEAFDKQLAAYADNPLGALVGSVGYVVSELVNTAAVVVTEFVNYISFAVTEFIHGLTDWFTAPAVFSGLYGDPDGSAQYWRAQSAENCVLQSAAMIVGQLTGTTPEEAEIADKAMALDSVVDPTRKMYLGLDTKDRVADKDAIALLDREYGIKATMTTYDKTEGNLALRALAAALDDNTKAVSVGVQGATIWNAVEGEPLPGISSADHQVVVTGIDFTERVVYLNDSGFPEQGKKMKVPLDAFMRAWHTDNYETWVAELKQPRSSTADVASARISHDGLLLEVAA